MFEKLKAIWEVAKELKVVSIFCALLFIFFVLSLWHPWIAVVITGVFTGVLIYFLVLEYKNELKDKKEEV